MPSRFLTSNQPFFNDEIQNLVIVIIMLAILSRANRNHRRVRPYLTRPVLLQNSRTRTPWQVLYRSHNDKAYIKTMGVSCQVFQYLLEYFAPLWNTNPVFRDDINLEGRNPRPYRRSLDAAGGLGILQFSIK